MPKISLSRFLKENFKAARYDRAVDAQRSTLLNNRKLLWINGKESNIRPGKYFACCEGFKKGQLDPEIFDRLEAPQKAIGIMKLIENMTSASPNIGWAKGLRQNVRLRVGGREVLVMDNHNFAAPFIMEAFKSGVIGKGSKMAHIDGHPDISGLWGSYFDHEAYGALKTPEQRFRYIVRQTTINDWQHGPLFNPGIVDCDKWKWYFIDPGNHRWYSQDRFVGGKYARYDHLSPYENGGNSIVDVDIDFLYPLDTILIPYEKQNVLKGKIPLQIKRRLSEVLSLAREAKVITIATSPCYIHQPRAIIYAKWLVDHLKKD